MERQAVLPYVRQGGVNVREGDGNGCTRGTCCTDEGVVAVAVL